MPDDATSSDADDANYYEIIAINRKDMRRLVLSDDLEFVHEDYYPDATPQNAFGLGFDEEGTLYATTNEEPYSAYTVSLDSRGAVAGPRAGFDGKVRTFEFVEGETFGWFEGTRFSRLDLHTNGVVSTIGDSGTNIQSSGYSKLNNLLYGISNDTEQLYTVERATGRLTRVGDLFEAADVFSQSGGAIANGVYFHLILTRHEHWLVLGTVNLASGQFTELYQFKGDFGFRGTGLAARYVRDKSK